MPKTFALDPRWFQVIFQAIFLSYGISFLAWNADWLHYILSIGGCLLFQFTADSLKAKRLMTYRDFNRWGFSVLISALSLCLLLKTNHWYISLLAAFLTVFSKYIFRFNKKHIFNPSAFGIIATNDRGDQGSKAGYQSCFPAHLYRSFILATGLHYWMANGLFYTFSYDRKSIALHIFYDQRSKDNSKPSNGKDHLGNAGCRSFFLFSSIQMAIQYTDLDIGDCSTIGSCP